MDTFSYWKLGAVFDNWLSPPVLAFRQYDTNPSYPTHILRLYIDLCSYRTHLFAMWLLNAATLKLEQFLGSCPDYAILSHRWQDDELTFQDMMAGTGKSKAGHAKVQLCCDEAVKHNLRYAWVDTCCIDKASSAELSEAINSMYHYYQKAEVCFVYLFDVEKTESSGAEATYFPQFGASTWWTRGWTLQELIAPSSLQFYDSTWNLIGTKKALVHEISKITGIDSRALEPGYPEWYSVAQRMSWASRRSTQRVEDIAYSLLGIFDVNMPLLYGEGKKAFIRLQEEIMKHSNDQSIFAWSSSSNEITGPILHSGLLAYSPDNFRHSSRITPSIKKLSHVPYAVTNFGLSITFHMVPWTMNTYLVALDCVNESAQPQRVGIFLKLLPETNQAARVAHEGNELTIFDTTNALHSKHSELRRIYVRQQRWIISTPGYLYGFWIRTLPDSLLYKGEVVHQYGSAFPISFTRVDCRHTWDPRKRLVTLEAGEHGLAGRIWYGTRGYGQDKWERKRAYTALDLGFDGDFNPICVYRSTFLERSSMSDSDLTTFGMPVHRGTDAPRLLQGDRLTGMDKSLPQFTISIQKELVGAQHVWVVYIKDRLYS